MYLRWLPFLNKKKIVLGSSSPQRQKILSDLNINFVVEKSNFEENISKEEISPKKYVELTCLGKFNNFIENNIECDILITLDTIIEFNNKIYEKPKNKEELKKWFKLFSNVSNKKLFITSNLFSNEKILAHTFMIIGIFDNKKLIKKEEFLTSSFVNFIEMNDEIIDDYVNTEEPYNKAGGFGIQGLAKSLIKGIEGDFYNVVGFPVCNFTNKLVKICEEVYGKNQYKNFN